MPRKSWWARLPFGVRMAAGATAVLITVGGGIAGVYALTRSDSDAPRIVTALGEAAETAAPTGRMGGNAAIPPQAPVQAAAGDAATDPRTSDQADRTATRGPRRAGEAQAVGGPGAGAGAGAAAEVPRRAAGQAGPARQPAAGGAAAPPADAAGSVVTTRTETETRDIPFQTQVVRDPSLPRGAKRVESPGVPGEETLSYLVTFTDGRPTDRRLVDSTVTREPQQRVIAFGTRRFFGGQFGGFGSGPGNGFGIDRDRYRECQSVLDVCRPLGRASLPCPDQAAKNPDSKPGQENGIRLTVEQAELLDAGTLDLEALTSC